MTVRLANDQDLNALISLNADTLKFHATAYPTIFRADASASELSAALKTWLVDPDSVWLIAEDQSPRGYLYARFQERRQTLFQPALRICVVEHLSVDATVRRRGVARRLIETLRLEMSKRSVYHLEMTVWAANTEARAAFRRLGFTALHERMVFWVDQ